MNKTYDKVESGPQGTRVLRPEKIKLTIGNHRRNPDESSQPGSEASLVGVNGIYANRRFEIPIGRSTVGRNGNNTIVIDHDSVSLVHARLIQRENEWWILNLLSTNGTFVNNRKVTDCTLNHGDHVRFGEVEFVFHRPEPAGRSALNRLRAFWSRVKILFGRRENP